MPYPLKYNTASQEVPLGYFLDSTDGDTEETGLTIANTDIKLHKAGATTLANKNSGGGTHISNGIYYATLDATDTNTYAPLVIFVHVSGALAVRLECVVMNADAYDALYAANGTGNIETNVVEWSGTAVASPDTAGYPVVTIKDGTGQGEIALTSGAVDNVTLVATTTTNTDMRGTDSAFLAASAPTNFSDLSITATTGLVDITQVAADKAWGTTTRVLTANTNLNDVSAADVNTQVDTALADIGLDHLVSAAVTGTDITDNSIVAKLVSASATADWDDFVNTTDSLQAVRDHIGDGTNLTEAGGTGDHLTAITVSALGATAKSEVNAEVDTALATTTYGEPAGVPAATASLKDKIGWLAALARNKFTSTSTTQTLRNDADDADIATSTHSDDGTTYTRGEWT